VNFRALISKLKKIETECLSYDVRGLACRRTSQLAQFDGFREKILLLSSTWFEAMPSFQVILFRLSSTEVEAVLVLGSY
jgi:hypothetical protein